MRKLSSKIRTYIDTHYLEESGKSIAKRFGCTDTAVQNYKREKGLIVPPEIVIEFRIRAMRGRTSFTQEEDVIIRKNYLLKPVKALAEEMNRSATGIMGRLKAMGLSIPVEIVNDRKLMGRIKKGDVPPNKGKKQSEYMSPDAIARTAATRFKIGNEPPNTKYDGFERISKDGYVEIRIRKGTFRAKHRVEWEKVNGPIPSGHCLWFKDGNPLNAEVSNLELITRKENRLRNSSSVLLKDRYVANCIAWRDPDLKEEIIHQHPALIQAKRTELLINRKIKEHGQK